MATAECRTIRNRLHSMPWRTAGVPTQIVIHNVRSIQLSDVYASETSQKLNGARECMRTLRVQSDDGEVRIVLSGDAADNIQLSYLKR